MDKDSLIEQLKKQQTKKEVYEPTDSQNRGLNRIYFFQRVSDEFIFPVDTELAAHHLLRRKDFALKYRYIGWSHGKHFATYKMKPPTRMQLNDKAELTEEGRQAVDARMLEYNEVLSLELQDAIDNPDKTPPRDFRRIDLGGNVMDAQMSGWLGQMR